MRRFMDLFGVKRIGSEQTGNPTKMLPIAESPLPASEVEDVKDPLIDQPLELPEISEDEVDVTDDEQPVNSSFAVSSKTAEDMEAEALDSAGEESFTTDLVCPEHVRKVFRDRLSSTEIGDVIALLSSIEWDHKLLSASAPFSRTVSQQSFADKIMLAFEYLEATDDPGKGAIRSFLRSMK